MMIPFVSTLIDLLIPEYHLMPPQNCGDAGKKATSV
jgi:hypothetical protein